ncbi:phage tail terminator-like protein [Parvibaculum sp.]|uniref:phage tail terminator-like protein n=1 Tax=Parvibaculum sp. TaxID=2024848 RepID=UPI001D94F956|nr:phage tail terminator-like protein [Parvibaculum sp.]MBX3490905.1 DUF4128 domain-containing protein [Parvibaculum sp.]
MTATSIEARITDALCTRLGTLVFTPAIPVAWPNLAFTPPSGRYLRASLMRGRTEATAFKTDTQQGIFQISVFSPVGAEGAIPADNVAGAIVAHFPRGLWLPPNGGVTVRVRRSWAGSAIKDNDRWHVPVSVDWFAQVNSA